VLLLAVSEDDDQLKLRLRHRTAQVDAEGVDRILGYHLTALEQMLANIDSDHQDHSLLSDEELQYQLEGLAGPHRDLPDRRLHELLEQAVVKHPDAIAAVHGDREWTYAELNARANQLARALLHRRVRRETVVAVVTERNLDWMASVLAIFKVGAVYLPIEPHFPADRIAATLSRAGCKLVMTEPGSTETLYQAFESLTGLTGFFVKTAYQENHADHNIDITVQPNQLAYIYFTSGSTGQPKGAMCEHAGMLNHMYAKIDDLEIGNGEIVAQIAPQCFDISLWQLLSALLVGGRTVIVEQDTLLEPGRFIRTIVGSGVGVMQVVPSYLEVLLSYLDEHPAQLPELHCVSVTGEAVTLELVRRWFAAQPTIKLANAYGLTETSDDTNHEVMNEAPALGPVPLGRPVNNVDVRVVDERLSPVPLGAPGEIVFAGVCVGRGYINDPERSKAAFMTDPLDPSRRFYRSGDYGRWRPDGKLEFLGRRDSQVKIRGFRIEIGEIENTMLRLPGIRQGAVIVTERADRTKQLVAFYSGNRYRIGEVQNHLRESLPEYMIPSVIHWQENLPLSDNGKIHRKTLAAISEELEVVIDLDLQVPATPAERQVADAWAKVIGISPQLIGRQDDFFDRGGTSLSAVQLVIELDSGVELKDVTENPVLADLALLMDGTTESEPEPLPLRADVAGVGGKNSNGVPPSSSLESPSSKTLLVDRSPVAVTQALSTIGVSPRPVVVPSSPVNLDVQPERSPVIRVDSQAVLPMWVSDNRESLLDLVIEYGSVLVRGLELADPTEVGVLASGLVDNVMQPTEAFAPREALPGATFSSSAWPANQQMCMHHELSYRLETPGLMMFACLVVPTEGGGIPLAEAARVLDGLPDDLVDRLDKEGWMLTRSYNNDVGLSFAEAFGTEKRAEVEKYCRANAIEFEWQPDGGLRTRQHRRAIVRHPASGERCWFNQVAFLSEWTMNPEVRDFLVDLYGEDGLPFNTRFGNGDPIDGDTVQLINEVYDANTMRQPLSSGDVLLVDNIRMAHSREPFEGDRQVIVAMGEPVRFAEFSESAPTLFGAKRKRVTNNRLRKAAEAARVGGVQAVMAVDS
ncbi:MAG: amino acid adenylation domain-containing protein, partial [Acidimicrobiia bacterium]